MSKEIKQIPTFIWDYDKINNALDFKVVDDALTGFLVANDLNDRIVIYKGNMGACLQRYKQSCDNEIEKLEQFKKDNKKMLKNVKPVKVYVNGKELKNGN